MSKLNNGSVFDKIEDLYESILDMLFPSRAKGRQVTLRKQRKRANVKREKAQRY
jgi:hypothetical protein